MPTFTPPTRPYYPWGGGDQEPFKHFGTVLEGITIYKNSSGWHMTQEGYEESELDGATVIYRGGREYLITTSAYNDVTAWLDTLGYEYPPSSDVYEGLYPGPETYPGPDAFPGPAT